MLCKIYAHIYRRKRGKGCIIVPVCFINLMTFRIQALNGSRFIVKMQYGQLSKSKLRLGIESLQTE